MTAGVATTRTATVATDRPLAGARTVARIDALNIALMLAAAAVACVAPVELFAVSYVVLGPLHYLTQLAWLRDRRWFTRGRLDPWLLAIPAAALAFGNVLDPVAPGDWRSAVVPATLVAAAVLTTTAQRLRRLALLVITAAVTWGVRHDPFVVVLSLMLPTAIHIFVFTGGFMLTGALRNRSATGIAGFVLFVAIAAVLLFAPIPPTGHDARAAFVQAVAPFDALRERLGSLLGLASGRRDGIERFLAWSYSYHYLNWFSKTRLIGWHRGTAARRAAIAAAWIACVALYAIDYTTGFVVVGLIGMLHVVLELPLDVRTVAGLPATVRTSSGSSSTTCSMPIRPTTTKPVV